MQELDGAIDTVPLGGLVANDIYLSQVHYSIASCRIVFGAVTTSHPLWPCTMRCPFCFLHALVTTWTSFECTGSNTDSS
jgi:hypothetical protein